MLDGWKIEGKVDDHVVEKAGCSNINPEKS